jgi:hypothetical protein
MMGKIARHVGTNAHEPAQSYPMQARACRMKRMQYILKGLARLILPCYLRELEPISAQPVEKHELGR